jgi:acyl-CoA synthetase (AMP-forming)/AMP-acid ligase II
MPLTKISAAEIVGFRGMTEQGFGLRLGRPLPERDVKIIPIGDGSLNAFSAKDLLPQGEVGELVARGPMVAESYFELPQAKALSMLLGPDGRPWRRVGDVGWRDAQGHIWFRGRKNQRVTTGSANLHAIPSESIFNNHPLARRSALVGIGDPGSQKARRGGGASLQAPPRGLEKPRKGTPDPGQGQSPRPGDFLPFSPRRAFPWTSATTPRSTGKNWPSGRKTRLRPGPPQSDAPLPRRGRAEGAGVRLWRRARKTPLGVVVAA